MRPVFIAILAILLLNLCAVQPDVFAARLPLRISPSIPHQTCGNGYRCQNVHVQLCIKRPAGRNIWAIGRKDAQLRRGVRVADCTQYAVGIGFLLRYNGRQAQAPRHTLRCTVQAQHGVSVVIEKCYSIVQRNAQKRFLDLVSGARVCLRAAGARGRGCHSDYAINVYAHADGRLIGETWVGFRLYMPRL